LTKTEKSTAAKLKVRRILVIRTDRIGDVILTLPLADALKKHFPGSEIDFLVDPKTFSLVSEYPNINKVHTIEKVTASGIKKLCKETNYDLAIVVYPLFAIAVGLYLAGVNYRLGTAYRWYSFLFNLKRYEHRKKSVKHELEYNIGLLEELGIENIAPTAPVLPVNESDLELVKSKLKEKGIWSDRGFIIIHVPSLGSAKVWKDENFTALIKLLLKDSKFRKFIMLSGTIGDEEQVKSIAGRFSDSGRVIPVLDLNLIELKAAIKLAELFIGNSTGPIHIAAAVGTFVIGFYSPIKVESSIRWGPNTVKKKLFSPSEDSNTPDIMDDITPADVYQFVMEYFSKLKQ
jgi:heptosyltransferase III